MKKTTIIAVLATALTTRILAGTFSDDFSTGLNSTYWSYSESTVGLYSVNAAGGNVALALPNPAVNPGGLQGVSIVLNLAALGGSVSGDFSAQIDFANAVIGPNNDQVSLDPIFADNFIFDDVYDLSFGRNVHVWTGAVLGAVTETATSGTFVISRTGSTIVGSFDGTPILTLSDSSALTSISFGLDNQPNAANDSPSVVFDNFSFTATSVPEPAMMSLLAIGGLACVFRRRRC
jgi:hypothetical protein